MNNDFLKRVSQWIVGEDTGLSAIAIWSSMMGVQPEDGFSTPSDPTDLGRSLRLLELVPEWKARISEMAIHGREWAALVSHWEELHQLMDDEVGIDWSKGNSALRTYERMKAIQGHHRT